MYDDSEFEGTAEFNMGVASMQRMDNIIRGITQYRTMLYLRGQPLHLLLLRLQRALYVELYPYLNDKEVEEAEKKFLSVFRENPIISTGTSLVVPNITETTMEDFELWCMKKMKDKGILQRFGEDPTEALF